MTPLLGPVESPAKQSATLHARSACLHGVKAALLVDGIVNVIAELACFRALLSDEGVADVAAELAGSRLLHGGHRRKRNVPRKIVLPNKSTKPFPLNKREPSLSHIILHLVRRPKSVCLSTLREEVYLLKWFLH